MGGSDLARRLSGPFAAWLRHRSLLLELTKREILGRYRGASFGLVWSLLSPFLMLGVYTVAFGYVLKARWPGAGDGAADFALLLFIGLITHGLLAECMTRAPALVAGNPNLVKKVVFPLEVLPWTLVLSAMFHALANAIVFAMLALAFRGELHATLAMLPLVLFPLALVALGVASLVSCLSVFLRDLGQVVGVAATALLFLSSAIVPVETLPADYQLLFRLNPLTFVIDQAREVAFWGRAPDWQGLAMYTLGALVFAYLAHAVFQKTRRGFADVL